MHDQMSQVEAMRAHLLSDATLSSNERDRREVILSDIAKRIQHDGDRVARPHADRARQFMPFAALKGYHDLAHDREQLTEPPHAMTEERAAALSQSIAHLTKGTLITVEHYEGDHYTTTRGRVSQVDETFRNLRVIKKDIAFDTIFSIELISQ